MLRLGLWAIAFLIAGAPLTARAASADTPIAGGLGIEFGKPVAPEALGAEVLDVPGIAAQALVPGKSRPWRWFVGATLPYPFRAYDHEAFVHVDEFGNALRIVAVVETNDCKELMDWTTKTLKKKYEVENSLAVEPPAPYTQAIEVSALNRFIRAQCGPDFRFDYVDQSAVDRWRERQKVELAAFGREQSTLEKRRMVLVRRRAMRFANEFTLGDQYRLDGAFGIEFGRPFAKNSSKKFPIDEPFYVVLPYIEDPFRTGDIVVEISPERHPVTIRGTFEDVSFEVLADALKAKYGTPSKSTSRHIIHPVGSKRAILKRLDQARVELAFIDTVAQKEQRERLWRKESEGL